MPHHHVVRNKLRLDFRVRRHDLDVHLPENVDADVRHDDDDVVGVVLGDGLQGVPPEGGDGSQHQPESEKLSVVAAEHHVPAAGRHLMAQT